jgi:excisionase family DNA binding protein
VIASAWIRFRLSNMGGYMATTEVMPQRLVPVKEWARIMGISVWTARQWAYSGKISSHKLGAKLSIPVSEVDRICSESVRPAVAGVR